MPVFGSATFPHPTTSPAIATFPGMGAAQSLLNTQKLSLPANTPVGTRVSVTDGFVVINSGDLDTDTFYGGNGTENSRTKYVASNGSRVAWNPDGGDVGTWVSYNPNGDVIDNTTELSDVVNPWDGTWSASTLTHPAVQELTAPSTAQGGVFVSDFGICKDYGTQLNGKKIFYLFGVDTSDSSNGSVAWSPDIASDWGAGPSSAGFVVVFPGGDFRYYSTSAVPTPDLATNWKNASDDSPASITVSSITQGELDAGVLVAGAGTTNANDVYPITDVSNGKKFYSGLAHLLNLGWFTSWTVNGTNPSSVNNTAFPWQASFNDSATVTRDDVASEANWSVV